MKTCKVKDQEEGVKNAKLFYESAKLSWGLQVTYCYHDLIHMIENYLCHDLYDSDNGWGMGLGAKDQNDADVCTLAEILKKEDDEDEECKEENKEEESNNDDETEAADELLKKFINEFFPK